MRIPPLLLGLSLAANLGLGYAWLSQSKETAAADSAAKLEAAEAAKTGGGAVGDRGHEDRGVGAVRHEGGRDFAGAFAGAPRVLSSLGRGRLCRRDRRAAGGGDQRSTGRSDWSDSDRAKT